MLHVIPASVKLPRPSSADKTYPPTASKQAGQVSPTGLKFPASGFLCGPWCDVLFGDLVFPPFLISSCNPQTSTSEKRQDFKQYYSSSWQEI
jgi:hypothetical protein